jgi:putative tryptophan/tyrosine transport system substrate-binding protein
LQINWVEGRTLRAYMFLAVLKPVLRFAIGCVLTAAVVLGEAATDALPKVGEIWMGGTENHGWYPEAFREGLRDLGYIDGKNITLVTRFANGDLRRASGLVDELLALKVDVLYVSVSIAHIAKNKTQTIPIVCPLFLDPVAEGLVVSLARPGGNVTGISWQVPEVSVKRVELLADAMPGVKRVAALVDVTDRGRSVDAEAIRLAAPRLGLKLRMFEFGGEHDLAHALASVAKFRPQALIVSWTGLTDFHHIRIAQFARSNRIPWISEPKHFAVAGALLTYGADTFATVKHGAAYIDKILKGAKAADLPIEQPTRFLLVVNQKSAKTLRIALPEAILLRADEVIR